jgi:hypothetical protein
LHSKSLGDIKAFEENNIKLGKKTELKGKGAKGAIGITRLPTLQGGYSNDPRIINELNIVKEENEKLKENIKYLQTKVLDKFNSII